MSAAIDEARNRLEQAIRSQYVEELGDELTLGQLRRVTRRSRGWLTRRIADGTIVASFDGTRHRIPVHDNWHILTRTGIRPLPRPGSTWPSEA